MDQSLFIRAPRLFADRQPAPIGHDVLVATISAQQSATATARAQALAVASGAGEKDYPLVELLLSGPSWREAASAQQGRFSRPRAD